MMKKKTKIKFHQGHKSTGHPFVIYIDFERMHEKIDSCGINSKKFYTISVTIRTPCRFSVSIKFLHDESEMFRGVQIVWSCFAMS